MVSRPARRRRPPAPASDRRPRTSLRPIRRPSPARPAGPSSPSRISRGMPAIRVATTGHLQRHRLQQDVRQPLAQAAQGEDVHRLVQGDGVRPDSRAGGPGLASPSSAIRASSRGRRSPSPRSRSSRSNPGLQQAVGRPDEHVEALLAGEPADGPDDQPPGGDPRRALASSTSTSPGELLGVDGVLDQQAAILGHPAGEALGPDRSSETQMTRS